MKYKVVIIGAGNIASNYDTPDSENCLTHAHAIVNDDALELCGFYDISLEIAEKAALKWGGEAFCTIKEAVDAADIICCSVPEKCRLEVMQKITYYINNQYIIMEKPLAKNLNEAKLMVQLLAKYQSQVQINYSRRFLDEFWQVRELIKNGAQDFLGGVGLYGKGINHNGSHMVDLFLFLCGDVDSVSCIESLVDKYEEDISVNVLLNKQGYSFLMKAIPYEQVSIFEMDIMYSNMRIKILDGGKRIQLYFVHEDKDYEGYREYILEKEIYVDYNQALPNLYKYILSKNTMRSNLTNAKKVMEICDAIRRSYEENHDVVL